MVRWSWPSTHWIQKSKGFLQWPLTLSSPRLKVFQQFLNCCYEDISHVKVLWHHPLTYWSQKPYDTNLSHTVLKSQWFTLLCKTSYRILYLQATILDACTNNKQISSLCFFHVTRALQKCSSCTSGRTYVNNCITRVLPFSTSQLAWAWLLINSSTLQDWQVPSKFWSMSLYRFYQEHLKEK